MWRIRTVEVGEHDRLAVCSLWDSRVAGQSLSGGVRGGRQGLGDGGVMFIINITPIDGTGPFPKAVGRGELVPMPAHTLCPQQARRLVDEAEHINRAGGASSCAVCAGIGVPDMFVHGCGGGVVAVGAV